METAGLNRFKQILQQYKLSEKITAIYDIGARDLDESVFFATQYPEASVFSFECNPQTLPICRQKASEHSNITLIEKAVNNYDGNCTFYAIDPEKTVTTWKDGNPGASSLFKANGSYDHIEKYVQREVAVECIRLDTLITKGEIMKPEAIWMDLQGAELLALEGLGHYLEEVKVIYTEAEINPMYEGQCLFKDINDFLSNHFSLVHGDLNVRFGTDVVYVNKSLL